MFDESSLVEPKDLLRFFHGFVTGFEGEMIAVSGTLRLRSDPLEHRLGNPMRGFCSPTFCWWKEGDCCWWVFIKVDV